MMLLSAAVRVAESDFKMNTFQLLRRTQEFFKGGGLKF